jgi:hypothetical protein
MSNPGAWKLTELLPCSQKTLTEQLNELVQKRNERRKNLVALDGSPAAQFDESHAKWLVNGREC